MTLRPCKVWKADSGPAAPLALESFFEATGETACAHFEPCSHKICKCSPKIEILVYTKVKTEGNIAIL